MWQVVLLATLGSVVADERVIPRRYHLYQPGSTGPNVLEYKGEPTLDCNPGMFPPGAWTDYAENVTDPQQLFGTTYAQKVIYRHQHPLSCENAKFLIHEMDGNYGVGAMLPKYGQGLALALQLNRIYVVGTSQTNWENNAYCGDDGHYDSCYFLPFSNCTLSNALEGRNLWEVPKYNGVVRHSTMASKVHLRHMLFENEDDQSHERSLLLTLEEFGEFDSTGIPYMFLELLSLAPIDREHYYYWWRAQSMAYIMRPNARTRFELEVLRKKETNWNVLPSGTICVQIRHGDKIREAPSAADDVYLRDVLRLLREFPDLRPSLYMVSLDAQSINFFDSQSQLDIYYTDIPRIEHSTDNLMTVIKEPWEEIMNVLLDMQYSMQAEAYVGVLTSNFGRMLDYLRATVGCKANRVYLDALHGPNPLKHIHCRTKCVF